MPFIRRSSTFNEATLRTDSKKFQLNFDLNNNKSQTTDDAHYDQLIEEESFAWDWPFCNDGMAYGAYTKEKFIVCLPFNNGGTGESNGNTRRFERIAQSDFSWSLGLSRDSDMNSNGFWRLEIEVIRHLNSLVLVASRETTRYNETTKRLKRFRKTYRLPDHYDVGTTATQMHDWGVVVEAQRKKKNRPLFRRANTHS